MIKAWLVTTVVFLVGDIVWLACVRNTFFVSKIKHLMHMTEQGITINYVTALLAYLVVSAGITWFVIMPLLHAPYSTIFLQGALFGFCIYGVYEFTNHAILNGWSLSFLTADLIWGTVWCGVMSVIGVALLRYSL